MSRPEPIGEAGLGGSAASSAEFRLASGVTVGPAEAGNALPLRPPAPPKPPMRLGWKPDGQAMSARPRTDWGHPDMRMVHPAAWWILGILACVIAGLAVALVGELHL